MAFYSQAGLGQPTSYFPMGGDPEELQRLYAARASAMPSAPAGLGAVAQPPAQPAPAAAPQAAPTIGQRIQNGLGALFPVDPNSGIDPAYAKQLQNNAILKLGLGMVAAGRQPGASFGSALASGLGGASSDLNGALQTAYRNAVFAKQEKRADDAEVRAVTNEQRLIDNAKWSQEFQQSESQRAQTNFDAQQKRLADQQKADAEYRNQQLELEKKRVELEGRRSGLPAGYEMDPKNPGGLRPIPGGPADPNTGRGKITDAERLTAAYAQRMKAAGEKIDSLDYVPTASELSAFNYLIGEPGIKQSMANQYLSPQAKQYFQALQDFSRAKLRKESGAVIGKDEISGDLATFFPLPGDDPDTRAQKKAARDTALQGMITAAGPAYQTQQPAAPSNVAPTQAPNGALIYPNSAPATGPARKNVGGKNYVQIGGHWYVDDGT